MTCLKNDFVHHGRPITYEVLPRILTLLLHAWGSLCSHSYSVRVSLDHLIASKLLPGQWLHGNSCVDTSLYIKSGKKPYYQKYRKKCFHFTPYGLAYIGFTHLEFLIYFQWWSFTSGTWMCFSPLLFGDQACQRLCQMQSKNSLPLLLADSPFSSLVVRKQCCLRSIQGNCTSSTGNCGIMILLATHVILSLSLCAVTAQRQSAPQTLLLFRPATG